MDRWLDSRRIRIVCLLVIAVNVAMLFAWFAGALITQSIARAAGVQIFTAVLAAFGFALVLRTQAKYADSREAHLCAAPAAAHGI